MMVICYSIFYVLIKAKLGINKHRVVKSFTFLLLFHFPKVQVPVKIATYMKPVYLVTVFNPFFLYNVPVDVLLGILDINEFFVRVNLPIWIVKRWLLLQVIQDRLQ